MSRLKTFFKYLVWIVLFFIFSQVMIYFALNTSHKNKTVEIKSSIIKEAEVKANSVSGTAKCKIYNDTQNNIQNKYIKIDCYSKNGVLMGTKYIKVENIPVNEEKEYEVRFNFNKVNNAIIQIVDEISEDVEETQLFSDPKMNLAMTITALIFLVTFA